MRKFPNFLAAIIFRKHFNSLSRNYAVFGCFRQSLSHPPEPAICHTIDWLQPQKVLPTAFRCPLVVSLIAEIPIWRIQAIKLSIVSLFKERLHCAEVPYRWYRKWYFFSHTFCFVWTHNHWPQVDRYRHWKEKMSCFRRFSKKKSRTTTGIFLRYFLT